MARIRSMKPEMRTSLVVASWPREVRLFWAYLWGYLDDHGYGVDDPRLIKADTFPLDDDVSSSVVEQWMRMIVASGPLCRYTANGRAYVHAVNWGEHQKPQHPGKPRIPPCTRDHSGGPPEGLTTDSGDALRDQNGAVANASRGTTYIGRAATALNENTQVIPLVRPSGNPHETLTPEQGAGSREQGVPPTAGAPAALALVPDPTPDTTQTIVAEWIEHCRKRPPNNVLGQVARQVKAMLAEGVDPGDVRAGLDAWHHKGVHPSVLPSIVNELMNASPTRASPRPSTSDLRARQALDAGDRVQARIDAQALEATP
jgi:hypothetical protein